MAPRAFWKGYLKLSLVTCPATMEPARTDGETLRFHTVSRETGNRVESRYVDAASGKPVAEEDSHRGLERGVPRGHGAGTDEGVEPTGDNVVSIMDALKRSVAAGKGKG